VKKAPKKGRIEEKQRGWKFYRSERRLIRPILRSPFFSHRPRVCVLVGVVVDVVVDVVAVVLVVVDDAR
jgi:hypothetical protein